MANTPPASRPPARPAMDEWGLYDPEQAGLAALFAKIDSRTDVPKTDAAAPATGVPAVPLPPRASLRDAT